MLRVNHGNLIQFGSEYLPSSGATAPPARLERESALAVLARHLGVMKENDELRDPGSLHVIPIDLNDGESRQAFKPGAGRGLARVW